MKKKLVALLLGLIIFHAPTTMADEKAPFSDVAPGEEHFIAINYLYNADIVSGYPDGSFQPDKPVTRAEALKMIMLAFDVPLLKKGVEPVVEDPLAPETTNENTVIFKDLDSGKTTTLVEPIKKAPTTDTTELSDIDHNAWYIEFVESGLKHKLVSGYEDQTFRPHNTINLVEALKISLSASQANLNLLSVPDEIFTDVKKEDWFSAFALYAKDHELVDIAIDNTINPAQEMTRGKLSELIYRIIKSKEGYGFGVASYYGDGANGANTASGTALNNSGFQAAHKTLPFNTKVRVSNPTNGKFVDVTIVDRGPYTHGRVLDLTKAAFSELDNPGRGVLKIHYQILNQDNNNGS